jgi:aryl-alcohol dehydrogenase-like predicted oxidoreductase
MRQQLLRTGEDITNYSDESVSPRSLTLARKLKRKEQAMRTRRFGRTGWEVSEIGVGMWGMGDWSGSDDDSSNASLEAAVAAGCNFFDTAWSYGEGHSERLLGGLIARHSETKLFAATKIPPKNRVWPSKRGMSIEEVFPSAYIKEQTDRSLGNLGVASIDLMQFHVWEDAWASEEEWQKTTRALTDEGLVKAWGVSINRWEPSNALDTLRTGAIDAVQVIYNIFDQSPEDDLFPLCKELDIGVIARVPFDEGSLTGTLTKDSSWPEGDWRNTYFVPENLTATVERADALKPLVPREMSMPEMALRFILSNEVVGTIIPGMRSTDHVSSNTAVSDGRGLDEELIAELRKHRWDRQPTEWSQ